MTDPLRPVPGADLLRGVRVVELSHRVAGAYCGKVLAQLGAEVTRWGPATDAAVAAPAMVAMQAALHGLKTVIEDDGPALDAAIAGADIVVVEPGCADAAMASRVDALLAIRDRMPGRGRLVVISAGSDGEAPGSALTSAAWSGMSWAIGEQGREPLTLPADVPEYVTGINAVAPSLASLLAGDGIGRKPVSVSARSVLAFYVGMLAPNHIAYGRPWQRAGRRTSMSGGMYPCGLFPCRDGFVVMYCRRDSEWRGLMKAMGNPEWSSDPRFADPRVIATRHADEADARLMPWLLGHSRAELTQLGLEYGFAVGPVRLLAELLTDEQFGFRGSFEQLPADAGPVMAPTAPWRLYDKPASTIAARAWPVSATPAETPSALLSGLRVLDLSWVWSGPMVTAILADLGAEVIKIEHPSHLDSVRTRGRPPKGTSVAEGPATEVNPWFNQLNHGKLSAVVDIKSAEGQRAIRQLARSCDVVVENMRPGVLDRLALGYADLAAENPAIVMMSMSMAGAAGPLSQMKGYAGIMSALAGLEALVGYPGRTVDEITGMMMTAFGDPNAAIHAISVLLAALFRRRRTGRGAWIDLAQTDAILSIMTTAIVGMQGAAATRIQGNGHPRHVPHGHFACQGADTWIAIAVQSDQQWRQVARRVGADHLAALTQAERQARRPEIERAVRAWAATTTQADAVAHLQAAGVPISTFEATSSIGWMRRFAIPVDHPHIGTMDVYMPPWYLGGMLPGAARPAPLLGAHTGQVFGVRA